MDITFLNAFRKFLFSLYLPFTIIHLQAAQSLIHTHALLSHAGDRRAAIWTNIPWQFHELAAMMAGFL